MEKRHYVLGWEQPDAVTSMGNIASMYRHQGIWKEAEVLELVMMEKRKHVLEEKHSDTLELGKPLHGMAA
jgi:hypothetical protein